MYCGKDSNFLTNSLIPYTILCIFLLQIYSQYSTLITLRTIIDNKRDGRNTMANYQITKDKQYDFNMNKLKEYFEDNLLMNINFIKKATLKLFEIIKNKKENKNDIRVFMFYYLILYDFCCLIIIYIFIYESIKAGIIIIIFQSFRFIFNAKRIQRFNNNLSIFSIIKNKIDNMHSIRGWNFFNPEGFLIIEFLCNFSIILDIYLLIIYIYRRYKYRSKKKNIIPDEKNNSLDEDSIEKKNNEKLYYSIENYNFEEKKHFLIKPFGNVDQDEEDDEISEESEPIDKKQKKNE